MLDIKWNYSKHQYLKTSDSTEISDVNNSSIISTLQNHHEENAQIVASAYGDEYSPRDDKIAYQLLTHNNPLANWMAYQIDKSVPIKEVLEWVKPKLNQLFPSDDNSHCNVAVYSAKSKTHHVNRFTSITMVVLETYQVFNRATQRKFEDMFQNALFGESPFTDKVKKSKMSIPLAVESRDNWFRPDGYTLKLSELLLHQYYKGIKLDSLHHHTITQYRQWFKNYASSRENQKTFNDNTHVRQQLLSAILTELKNDSRTIYLLDDFFDDVMMDKSDNTLRQKYEREVQEMVKSNKQSDITVAQALQQSDTNDTTNSSHESHATMFEWFKQQCESNGVPLGMADMKIVDAIQSVTELLKPALVYSDGENIGLTSSMDDLKNRLVVFDPNTGAWTHANDTWGMLLELVRPVSQDTTKKQLITHMITDALTKHRLIKKYSGSRYKLYKNGVIDLCDDTWTLQPLNSSETKNHHFTSLDIHNINFVNNPKVPIIKGARMDGNDWRPDEFISAYGYHDQAKTKYLLFLLSLATFGSHNFHVVLSIKGDSRWGKTTLRVIFDNLLTKTFTIPYSDLNEHFGMTDYTPNTALVWIDENNEGSAPLNDEGTALFDGSANGRMTVHVKGQGNLFVSDPPMWIIDGTQLIQAENMSTGPAGRTLAYVLPAEKNINTDKFYAKDINAMLSREDVLQWFDFQMNKAYKDVVDTSNRDSLTINLKHNNDAKLLPDFEKKWRNEMMQSSSNITEFMEDWVIPFVKVATKNPDKSATLLSIRFLYNVLYADYYAATRTDDPYGKHKLGMERFEREVKQALGNMQFGTQPVGSGTDSTHPNPRKQVSTPKATNFNWALYNEYYHNNKMMPSLQSDDSYPSPFGKKLKGWFNLVKLMD